MGREDAGVFVLWGEMMQGYLCCGERGCKCVCVVGREDASVFEVFTVNYTGSDGLRVVEILCIYKYILYSSTTI